MLTIDFTYFFFRRALSVIDKYFEELLEDQQFFATTDGLKGLLKSIPDEALRSQVEKKLEKLPESSSERWNNFINIYDSYCREVLMHYCY